MSQTKAVVLGAVFTLLGLCTLALIVILWALF